MPTPRFCSLVSQYCGVKRPLSVKQTVISQVGGAYARVPLIIAKFGTNEHESAIKSAAECGLFTSDLSALVPVRC